MSVTSATISVDALEYCKYSIGMNTITITATVTGGTLTAGDSFIFSVKRELSPNWPEPYRAVMKKTWVATPADVTNNAMSVSFRLGTDDIDVDGIARATTGLYDACVSPVDSPLTEWSATNAIRITILPTKEIRKEWCYGISLRTSDVVAPRFQPKKVTGVYIDELSSETVPGLKSLVFTVLNGVKSLSWDGGEPVVLDSTIQQYLLMDEYEGQYALATVRPALLPTVSTTEKILVAAGEMPDELIQHRIENALNSVEYLLGFPVEPHLYTSMPRYPGQTQDHNRQMDHWDRIGRPVDYVVPIDGFQWPSFRLPYQWCIKLHNLYGFHSVDKIIEIDGDWWNNTIDRMSGYVTLIPALASFSRWTVFTHPMLAPFFMHRNIAGFWQYNATFGLPDLSESMRAPVREMIARTAAISVLTEAQRALQGGIGSEMTNRDGLGNSRNFSPGGAYSPTIQQHQQWLQLEGPRIRFKLGGIQMGMLGAS